MQTGVGALASETIVEQVQDQFAFRFIDKVAVKGKAQAVRVYELLGERRDSAAALERAKTYEAALEAYFARDFLQALARLGSPIDDPASRVLAARCAEMLRSCPPSTCYPRALEGAPCVTLDIGRVDSDEPSSRPIGASPDSSIVGFVFGTESFDWQRRTEFVSRKSLALPPHTPMRHLADRFRPLYRNASFRQLVLMNTLLGIASSFVQPFMSMFGTIEAKMSLAHFGTFMTASALSGIVVSTTLAHYSDTHFSRRFMLLLGSIAGALGFVGYAYLRGFMPLVLVGSLVLSVSSITFSQLFAYARELLSRSDIEPSQGAFYINVFRMFIALAWTVGPAVAAYIMVHFSYRGLFLCAAADYALLAVVIWLSVPHASSPAALAKSTESPPLLQLLARRDLLAHFGAFVLVSASMTIGMMNLPLLILKVLGGGASSVGIAYGVAPVFELPLMLYFGWLATKYPPERIIRLGLLFSLAYYVSLTAVTAPWHVYLCQSLSAAATSVIAGVAITYFQSHLPRHPGTATNLYSNAQRIGSTAGYFLFVGLAWRFGHRAVFDACALFAALGLCLMLVPLHVPKDEAALESASA